MKLTKDQCFQLMNQEQLRKFNTKKKDGTESAFYWSWNQMRKLSMYKLDKDGFLSGKTNILDRKEEKMMMVPKSAIQINDNEMLIHGKYLSKNRFGIIELD